MTLRLIGALFLLGWAGGLLILAPRALRLLTLYDDIASNRAKRTGRPLQVLHPLVSSGTVVQFGKRR